MIVRVSKWGNSLGVRLPSEVVKILALEDGDEVELHADSERSFTVKRKPSSAELLERIRSLRGRVPADFNFDRLDVNER